MVACQSLDFQFVDERGGRPTRVVLDHFDGRLIDHVEFFVSRHAALHDELQAKRKSVNCCVSSVTYDVDVSKLFFQPLDTIEYQLDDWEQVE